MTATQVENWKEAREKEKKRREDAIRLAEDRVDASGIKIQQENQFPYDFERCQLNFLVDFLGKFAEKNSDPVNSSKPWRCQNKGARIYVYIIISLYIKGTSLHQFLCVSLHGIHS